MAVFVTLAGSDVLVLRSHEAETEMSMRARVVVAMNAPTVAMRVGGCHDREAYWRSHGAGTLITSSSYLPQLLTRSRRACELRGSMMFRVMRPGQRPKDPCRYPTEWGNGGKE